MHTWIIGCGRRKTSCLVRIGHEILAPHLEWGFFYVCVLQCTARFFSGADAALLASADDEARQVSGGVTTEVRRRSGRSRWPRRETGNLGACGFGGRGGSIERSRRSAAADSPVTSRTAFTHHQLRAETPCAAIRREERFIFPLGIRLRLPA